MRPTIRSAVRKIPAGLAAPLAGLALAACVEQANITFQPLFGGAPSAEDAAPAEDPAKDVSPAPDVSDWPCYAPLSDQAKAELARAGYSPASWPGLKAYLDQGGRLKQLLPACE